MIFDLFFFVLAFFMSIPFVGAWYASSRGKNFWLWYFIGLFLPIISFIILLCLPDEKNPLEKELQQIRIQQKMLGLKNEVPDNDGKFLKWLKKNNNIIQFEISDAPTDNKLIYPLIDQVALMDLIQEQDKKKAKFQWKKKHLAFYEGLQPLLILPPSKHLLGKSQNRFSGHTLVLNDSQNGEVILAKIEILRKYIIWHQFIKVKSDKRVRNYSKIGPFVFDRWQYELALHDVSYRYKKIV